MNQYTKFCRSALSLALALVLLLGMSANAIQVSALSEEDESRKDAILEHFFGDGSSPEEAFDKLLAETDKMENYVNQPFYYVTDADSFYVALGDETAYTVDKKGNPLETYVDKLAAGLGLSASQYANLAQYKEPEIQNAYAIIEENAATIAKADLITIGWSNFSATRKMFSYMTTKNADKVTKADWCELVGDEYYEYVEVLLSKMFEKMGDYDLSGFGSYDLKGGLEWYAFTYMSNAIHQSQVIDAVRQINADAVIVLVGTYNDLQGPDLNFGSGSLNISDSMDDLTHAINLLSSKNAEHYENVVYVDAPDVATTLKSKTSYTSEVRYVLDIAAKTGLPTTADGNDGTPSGHAYIANQILAARTTVCEHVHYNSEVLEEATCTTDGLVRHTCTFCRHEYTEVIPATDHSYGEWVEIGTNLQERTCEHCGATERQIISSGDVTPGDVIGNGDGLNIMDVSAMLSVAMGYEAPAGFVATAGDLDADGLITTMDVFIALSMVLG